MFLNSAITVDPLELNYSADNNSTEEEDFVSNEISADDPFVCGNDKHICKSFTAISKLQIKMNDLKNQHKAPLKLYDDMVNLFKQIHIISQL